MKHSISILICLILFSGGLLAGEQAPKTDLSSLRIVDIGSGVMPREDLYRDLRVLDDLGKILVAQPALADQTTLTKSGLSSRLIDLPADTQGLYVVSLRDRSADQLPSTVNLLYVHEDLALVAVIGPDAEVLASAESALFRPTGHYGLEKGFRQLSLERITPSQAFRSPRGLKPGSRAVDPNIAAMVSQVNGTNLQNTVQDLQNMGERQASSGAHVAETYLVNAFNAIGGLTVSTHNFSSSYSENVIAELPGTVSPSLVYIVGAHYDSISYVGQAPGADDNASGTAAVVEIARILSQYQFKYTLRFVCFSAEELGLIGSDAYCDWLVTQGTDVGAYINQDMNAYRHVSDPYDVAFITNYSSSSLINFCTDMYTTYVPALGITSGSMSGGTSDHQSFTQHGYQACFPFEDLDNYSPYIHTANDVIGTSANDFQLATMITQGVLASLATLASPVDLEIVHTPLADSTNASGPYAVTADVSSLIGSNLVSVTLNYDLGSGGVSKAMIPAGSGDEYIASIPGLSQAGSVKYYLEAEDDQGNTERLPDGLGPDEFEFFVGYFNDIFADDFELGDNGWTHGGSGQDDWMRNAPTGNGGYDPGYAWSGSMIWGNDLGPSGWNGNYQPNVDNWLLSPSIDCSGYTGISLRYRRWLTVEAGQYDQAAITVNGNSVFSNPYSGDLVDTEWVQHDIDISAFADNNPDVRLRYTLTTDGGMELGGWNIDDLHVGTLASGDLAELAHSEVFVMASTGGAITFTLNGAPSQSGRTYMLALSASGTSPGTQIGSVTVPLNRDAYTNYGIANVNTPTFDDFRGTLNAQGDATATFNAPVITDPNLIGKTLSFAWVTLSPINYASNPVDLRIVP